MLATVPYHIWRPSTSSGASGGSLLLRRLGTASILGCLGGVAFLAMGVYQKLTASEPYGIYDRAFRLRHNKGQVRESVCVRCMCMDATTIATRPRSIDSRPNSATA